MSDIRRIVVCEEPKRNKGCMPGPPSMPSEFMERMAARFGEAVGLPYVALGISLEQCEPTDFVFYQGFWDAFVEGTPHWTDEQRRLRAHRAVHLTANRTYAYAALLENVGFAFAIPPTEITGKRRGADHTFLYARRDIAETLHFDVSEIFRSKTYAAVTAPKGMSQEEMVARYLRAYWDKLGY